MNALLMIRIIKFPEESCPHDYVGKSGRRVSERAEDHVGDISCHIFKHRIVADHQILTCDDIKTIVVNGNGKLRVHY